jgi:hypothetical protein
MPQTFSNLHAPFVQCEHFGQVGILKSRDFFVVLMVSMEVLCHMMHNAKKIQPIIIATNDTFHD